MKNAMKFKIAAIPVASALLSVKLDASFGWNAFMNNLKSSPISKNLDKSMMFPNKISEDIIKIIINT